MTGGKSQEGLFLELLVESRQAGVTVRHESGTLEQNAGISGFSGAQGER